MRRDRDLDRFRGARGERPGGRRRPVESFITGLVMTVVFGTLMRLNVIPGFPGWVFGFPLVFGGILPMVRGLSGMIHGGVARVTDDRQGQTAIDVSPAPPQDEKVASERKILMLAREQGGVVTPALVALRTDLSLDKAGELLDDLARRGYAGMQVQEDGRVEYHFPEFETRGGSIEGP